MARCRHDNVEARAWSITSRRWYDRFPSCRYADLEDALVCLDCGAWLSLGPANDEPEAVQIEIRAAELAAEWDPDGEWTGIESLGMVSEGEHTELLERDIAARVRPASDLFAYLSGYLARCIAEHGAGDALRDEGKE